MTGKTRKTPKSPFFIFDAHCDTALRLVGDEPVDLGGPLPGGHVDIWRLRQGGVGAQVFACWVDPDLPHKAWMPRTLEVVAAVHEQARRHSERLEVALSGRDVERIRSAGRIAALIGVEGGHVLGDDPAAGLAVLHEAGARCLTLTWTGSNALADSSGGERRWGGLSPAGLEAIREMNRLGIVIDLSHASDEAFFAAAAVSRAPVLVSHSAMRALCDIPRNISDEMLRTVGELGGVACVNFFPAFLDNSCHTKVFEVWDCYRAERRRLAASYGGDPARADREILPRYRALLEAISLPGLPAVADHIEHAARIAGTAHVGIGSDFDGIAVVPPGLEDASRMQALVAELLRRGWSREDAAAVAGGNLLRLFGAACRPGEF